MRRGREKDLEKYINVRIAQLKQDMEKAHDDYDKQWYNRIIQELCWVKANNMIVTSIDEVLSVDWEGIQKVCPWSLESAKAQEN